jgi:ATP-binding protein involved in chromosome partitioning
MVKLPKYIAICALKGGVGKSTLAANLGLAFVRQGMKVGLIDIDVTGSNLYSALGLEHSPKWEPNSKEQKIVVPNVDGYWLLSVASYAGEDRAVMLEAGQYKELHTVSPGETLIAHAGYRSERNTGRDTTVGSPYYFCR